MTYDSPMRWDRPGVAAELDGQVKAGVLRGWEHTGGRYVVGFHAGGLGDPLEPATVVLTQPQVQAFLAGLDAALCWVTKVAEEVRPGIVADAIREVRPT